MSREADLYKDKIEVSLDGRQIFYLFFGGAVIVGLVFVLGVMVGRRVEARGHVDHARTQTATDPLAALDRLESSGGLSFKGALMGNDSTSDVERAIGEIERARGKTGGKPVDRKDEPKAAEVKLDPQDAKHDDAKQDAAKQDAARKDAAKQDAARKDAAKQEAAKQEAAKQDTAKQEAAKKPEVKPAKDPKPEVADAKPDVKKLDKPKADAKKADGEAIAQPEPAEAPKHKYTLQLSSFQDRSEADAFLSSMKASGYSAYVTEATVTGKTFYRVRMGSYRSIEAANDAKDDFEKSSNKSASVMRL